MDSNCSCRRFGYLCCAALALVFFAPLIGQADSVIRECVQNAKNNKKLCVSSCQETFKNDKLACGVNPDCHQACNAARDACAEEYENQLKNCLDGCSAPYEAAKEACKASTLCGPGTLAGACFQNADFRACLRPALVDKLNCSQDCRDSYRTNADIIAALKLCSKTAKTCHKACKYEATPTPTPAAN